MSNKINRKPRRREDELRDALRMQKEGYEQKILELEQNFSTVQEETSRGHYSHLQRQEAGLTDQVKRWRGGFRRLLVVTVILALLLLLSIGIHII